MKKAITILICLVFLAGCQTFKVLDYRPHKFSETEKHETFVYVVLEEVPKSKNDEDRSTAAYKTQYSKYKEQYLKYGGTMPLPPTERGKTSTQFELIGHHKSLSKVLNWSLLFKPKCDLEKALIDIDPDLVPYLKYPQQKAAEFAAVALVAAAGKLLSDIVIDMVSSKAQDIADASKFSFDNTVFLTADEFRRCKGIIIIRKSKLKHPTAQQAADEEKEKETNGTLGLILLLKVIPLKETACYVSPIFVRLERSAAQTVESNPKIDITIAIAVKAIAGNKSELPGLQCFGQAELAVRNLDLSGKKIYAQSDLAGIKSDLIPLPQTIIITEPEKPSKIHSTSAMTHTDGTNPSSEQKGDAASQDNTSTPADTSEPGETKEFFLSVSFAVVETGRVGFGLERTNAEIEAIKKAIGGGVSGMITERFD